MNIELNDKMFLGVLCKRGHNYNGTGKSPRYIKNPGSCTICTDIRRREWLANNPQRMKELQTNWNDANKERHNEWKREYRSLHPIRRYVNNAISDKRGFTILPNEIPITEDSLYELWQKQNGKCYWLNIDIHLDYPARHPAKANLDRLDCSKGYIQGNVVWASSFANRGRQDTSVEEFKKFLESLNIT